MKKVETWIETQKRDYKFEKGNDNQVNTLKKEQLNFKQRIAYDLIEEWVDKKVSPDGKDVKPLYLNLSGRAGCGKSAVEIVLPSTLEAKQAQHF